MNFCMEEVRAVLGDVIAAEDGAVVSGYSIDSRTLAAGDLFFAIEGEHFDGHDFVAQAIAKGAVAAVVTREQLSRYGDVAREKLVAVANTLDALQALASAARARWQGTLVGITGSVGKTTTKEAVAAVLRSRFPTLASRGNLNNHFGMPLQLLRIQREQKYAVLEMGMSAPGEIARLAAIARPDWGIVTVVAPVHTEFFADGIAGVARAKRELVEGLPASGVAFLNADDARVAEFGACTQARVVLFGRSESAAVRAEEVRSLGAGGVQFTLAAQGQRADCRLHLLGEHNVTNALAAAAVGFETGLSAAEIAVALATLQPPDKRGQTIHVGGAVVINDSYNSSPRALDAMVDALVSVPAKRHIVVAGEMLELGPDSDAMHAACGQHMAERGVAFLLGVRGHAQAMVDAANLAGVAAAFVATPEQAGDWLAANLKSEDAVLLKASRGVRLERALEQLLEARGTHEKIEPSSGG